MTSRRAFGDLPIVGRVVAVVILVVIAAVAVAVLALLGRIGAHAFMWAWRRA